jgi:hypothetical protein
LWFNRLTILNEVEGKSSIPQASQIKADGKEVLGIRQLAGARPRGERIKAL